jgi:hypothetical protein
MKTQKTLLVMVYLAKCLLQYVLTQLLAFVVFLFYPNLEMLSEIHPLQFVLVSWVTIVAGLFFTGCFLIGIKWLRIAPRLLLRLGGVLVGASLPLIVLIVILDPSNPGSPTYLISIFLGLIGFHLPNLVKSK